MAKAMGSPVEQAWRLAQQVDSKLNAKLAEKDALFQDIDYLIAQYRSACENVIFLDFEFAGAKNISGRLWEAHGKINKRYRKLLTRFRDEDGKKKPVEKRKMLKHYLEFIKTSSRHYRGYIQRLASHFGGIPEVDEIAHKFKLDALSADAPVCPSPQLRHLILQSCHQTLIRLGDLSRYRETELAAIGSRNWGPATGYYDLATAIYPASGASHNQLAVIALADGSHLRATYHLYRALSTTEAYPTAKANLEIEFKKILTAWKKANPESNGVSQDDGSAPDLIGLFVRLHAHCYKGLEFPEHDELENETLSQLALDLKERSVPESTLQKFILINIAAQHFAGIRVQDDPETPTNFQSFFFLLRLNVKTLFVLLQVLQPELEWLVSDDVTVNGDAPQSNHSEKVTAVTRRLLPSLRNYSSWVMANSGLLIGQVGDTALNVQIKELWKIYANSLTLIAATFPAQDLPSIGYLLEEDEDTIGFNPLDVDRVKRRYYIEDGCRKPRWHDPGVDRFHPNMEMLARIRDLLTDGLELAVDETIPIALIDGGTFAYQEEGIPSETLASPNGYHENQPFEPVLDPGDDQMKEDTMAPAPDDQTSESVTASETVSFSMSTAMNRMVDSLVGTDGDADTLPPVMSNSIENPATPIGGTLTAADLVSMVHNIGAGNHNFNNVSQNTSHGTPRPSLPSIWNTAFAEPPLHSPMSSQKPGTATRVSPQQGNTPVLGSMPDLNNWSHPGMPAAGSGAPPNSATTYYEGNSAFNNGFVGFSSPYDYGLGFGDGRRRVYAGTPPNGQEGMG